MFVLSGYTFSRRIFQGTSTSLHRGTADADGRPVLVKSLVDEYPSPRSVAQIRHEFAMERELSLPNVVTPLSLLESGNGLVLVWDDPGGETLAGLLTQGALGLLDALSIAQSIARTLATIHARGILHKGLHPENVLVDLGAGSVCLSGLGVSGRLAQETVPLTSPGALDAPLTTISPEQTGRMNRVVDRRSDLYSLGVVFYEMLVGEPPFSSPDPMALLYRHLVEKPIPPHERVPGLARVVSDIVMKLLSKNAEDRYQSAAGLASDIAICLDSLKKNGDIAPFVLAQKDHGDGLHLPQKLYGRSLELRALENAWERARGGTPELLLVRGYSGIGKSVLVHEIHKELTGAHGFFLAGKCEQLDRSTPYACFVQAFRELVHQLLMEPEETFERFKTQIQAALETNGQVLTAIIPELSRLIGPQPEVAKLAGVAARNRFVRVFQRFVQVFTEDGAPLVLFLDDLQWADLASLDLLAALLKDNDRGRLLVIGAYRTNEVDASHPLTTTLKEIAATAKVSAVELGPLAREDIAQLVADALSSTREAIASLADVVFDKTQGNPFFTIQLLTALHKDGHIHYDDAAGAYRWNIDGVRATAATDNVVAFMVERLGRLSPGTQHVLRLGACVGYRFDLQTLSLVGEAPPRTVAYDLWEALMEGAVVPLTPNYQFFRVERAEDADHLPSPNVSYRFLHDRVQQAAYEGIEEDKRAALHLKIGRLMLASHKGKEVGERLYELVSHLNLGRALITDAEERATLARLNLEAAKRAKAATAYESAARMLKAGLSMLSPTSFVDSYDLAFALHLAFAECVMLAGSPKQAEDILTTLQAEAKTTLERAEVLDLRAVLNASQGKPADAVIAGLEGLRILGVEVPKTEGSAKVAYAIELQVMSDHLAPRTVEALASAPIMTSPEKLSALRLARHLALSAFGVRPNLGYWLTAFAANLSFKYGNSEESAPSYALLGAVLATSTTRFAEAFKLGKLALALHEKRGTVHEACLLGFYFATISHYSMHWRDLLPYLDRAYAAGLESGDLMFLSYTCSHRVIARFLLGDPLADVKEENERMLALMNKKNLSSAAATQTIVLQTIRCLQGLTRSAQTLDDETFEEATFVESIEASRMTFAMSWFSTAKGILLFLDQDYLGALLALTKALTLTPIAFTPEARYYTCLSILALADTATAEERAERETILARSRGDLETWANACPENYLAKSLLVQAEIARVSGEAELAMDLYDRAIAAAREYDWPRDIALGNERCALFYLHRGRTRIARAYMTDACYAYARWGATSPLRRLVEKYPTLVPAEMQTTARGGFGATETVDTLAFVRGLQAISRQIHLEDIVEQVMRIVVHDAGAERGVLLLQREGALVVIASFVADSKQVIRGLHEPLAPLTDSADLATSVVRYVARLGESVILEDARQDPRFAADAYITAVQSRSIACLAITHQGLLKGVLYLENNGVAAAFTAGRAELLGLLASQAAISIDNAELYARVQSAKDALSRTNEALQAEVSQQTIELRETNAMLERELAERILAEEREIRMRENIIQMQSGMLAEMSTPVLPILKGIIIIPLIGSLDEARATEVLDAAIRGAFERSARIVILDVTGIGRVDSTIDTLLGRTARALALVGAELMVTGIRSAMAMELSRHATEIASIKTYATLESGVVVALKRLGRTRE